MADFTGGPGLLAFIATFTMVLAAVLLFRSLSKHLRKVRTHPPEGDAPGAPTVSSERPADEPPAPDPGTPDAGTPEAGTTERD